MLTMTDRLVSVGILTVALLFFGAVWIGMELAVARWRRRPTPTPFRQASHVRVQR